MVILLHFAYLLNINDIYSDELVTVSSLKMENSCTLSIFV